MATASSAQLRDLERAAQDAREELRSFARSVEMFLNTYHKLETFEADEAAYPGIIVDVYGLLARCDRAQR